MFYKNIIEVGEDDMKKKGFTLIELVFAISLLSIIVLITFPTILKLLESSRRSAFELRIKGIIHKVEIKNSEKTVNRESLISEYNFPTDEIDSKENQPLDGIVKVNDEGEISLAIYNKDWCAVKEYYDNNITIKSNVEGECVRTGPIEISDKIENLLYNENGNCKTDGTTYQYMGGCYIKAKPSKELKNHVWYNGFLWRIMGINSDGSVKMITEEDVTSIPYTAANSIEFSNSHVDKWLNEYFYNKLSDENKLKTDVIVDGVFCQGETTSSSSPSRTDCTNGTLLTRKVGLLSIDEYNLSWVPQTYLSNSQIFWTMSPYDNDRSLGWFISPFSDSNYTFFFRPYGIRPVINVNADTLITSGSGTLSDNYILAEYKENINQTGTLSNVKVGEFVLFNDKRYRVVENGILTKLILDGYYQEEGTVYTMQYGADSVFTNENRNQEDVTLQGIGYKLNTDVLDWLTAGSNQEKLKSLIIPSTWYQNNLSWGNSYETSLNETNPTRKIENVKVGLIRLGEMLLDQSYSMLTKNGSVVSSFENVEGYWTMTPYNTSFAWVINEESRANNNSDTNFTINSFALRPVINVSSNLNIIGGNGTLGNEYIIEVK